ncbi:MAG TPA: hypothetical protein ENO00_04430 [Deltaproteobacteria bacterium]|nr:hypothetical protein [Deltaproteobacteria bacterium]
MDFKLLIEKAWKLTISYIVPLILMTLVMFIVSFITFGILAPVTMAGYMHAILRMIREGREPRVQDVFSQMRLFLPLFLLGLVIAFVIMIGFMLLVLPGILAVLAVAFCMLYVLPLMTDKGMGVMEAVKESFRMSTSGNIVDQIVIVVIYLGLSVVGGSVFIGWLFTQPFATVFLMLAYEEKVAKSLKTETASAPMGE